MTNDYLGISIKTYTKTLDGNNYKMIIIFF